MPKFLVNVFAIVNNFVVVPCTTQSQSPHFLFHPQKPNPIPNPSCNCNCFCQVFGPNCLFCSARALFSEFSGFWLSFSVGLCAFGASVQRYIHTYIYTSGCAYNATPPGLTHPPPRIVPPLSQHQYLTCCIAVWKRRIFAFYCISFGLLSSAFKSSVKCFSMLHFLRVYLCVCVCIYALAKLTQIQVQIPISESMLCGFCISNLPAQTESNCETHLNDAPKIFSVYLHIVLWLPRKSNIISILLLARLKIATI